MKRKTKKLTSKNDWTCPIHNKQVQHRQRGRFDDDGYWKYAGEYYACPEYHECKYYVSPNGTIPII